MTDEGAEKRVDEHTPQAWRIGNAMLAAGEGISSAASSVHLAPRRISFATSQPHCELAPGDVHGPCRGVVYRALGETAPEAASEIHGRGFGARRLRPFGVRPVHSTAVEQRPAARRGRYLLGAGAVFSFGSPFAEFADGFEKAVLPGSRVRWGTAVLTVVSVDDEQMPDFSSGSALFSTVTPVLVKPAGGDLFVVPGEPGWTEGLRVNLESKATTAGLPGPGAVTLESAGPRRRLRSGRSMRVGSCVTVRLEADPRLLAAVWAWGLGSQNSEGFGWIR